LAIAEQIFEEPRIFRENMCINQDQAKEREFGGWKRLRGQLFYLGSTQGQNY
jgi:hypothetical protein